ncbi:D-glycero-beta-D-manno-heptose 1,7-bisphosphate 7-phosphatase [Thalassotalea crassostreae]|uniref:D-glycero-beta-D-manno-heptose 1,7-bisphosphate 7-phosphatase n=1 Tax=Thalassotalea crassostreae TaxID=1763536 RepID=UPI0008380E1D|nr:D-glycero-beta-D-manno-heptose 1,7-bisphosphate 7-phosphatase [Thalassotalea crassostreae]
MNKALFLDRDGIINIDHGYVYQADQFEFVEGIFELCQHAQAKGFQIIVITNQSGIARGMYGEEQFLKLTDWMKKEFLERQVNITDVYFCPHHPTKGNEHYKITCDCRKPAPGMLIKAAKKHNINFSESFFVGDKVSDMQAAEAAGIENRILVSGKYGDDQAISALRLENVSSIIDHI